MLDLPAYLKLSDSAKEFHNALIALLKKYDANVDLWIYQSFDNNIKAKDGVCLALVKNWLQAMTSGAKNINNVIKGFTSEFNRGIPTRYDDSQIILNKFSADYAESLKCKIAIEEELKKCDVSIQCLTLLKNVINEWLINYTKRVLTYIYYGKVRYDADIYPKLSDDFKHDIDNLQGTKESLSNLSKKVNTALDDFNRNIIKLKKKYDLYTTNMALMLNCLYNFGCYQPKYFNTGNQANPHKEDRYVFDINIHTKYSELEKIFSDEGQNLANYLTVIKKEIYEGVNNCYLIRMIDIFTNDLNNVAHAIGLYVIRSMNANDSKVANSPKMIYMLDANTGLVEFKCNKDSGDHFFKFFLEYVLHMNCFSKQHPMYPSRIYMYAKTN